MQKLKKLHGIKTLSKKEQRSIMGGCPANAKKNCEKKKGCTWVIIPELGDCGTCECKKEDGSAVIV